MLVGTDHTKTGLQASYAQVGLDLYAGHQMYPTPPTFTKWLSNPEFVPYGAHGPHGPHGSHGPYDGGASPTSPTSTVPKVLKDGTPKASTTSHWLEFTVNGATCSEDATIDGTCVRTNLNVKEGTVAFGARTYATKGAGLGPSKDEMAEVSSNVVLLYKFNTRL